MFKTTEVKFLKPKLQPLGVLHDHPVDVLRLDLIHPEISGNKWFKLKYNLEAAEKAGIRTLLTFGGAHSNHIAATAAAAALLGIKAIAVVRGEEPESHTLQFASNQGMQIHRVSRRDYSNKTNPEFLKQLEEKFGKFYLVPEGGNNEEGILGCKNIMTGLADYDYILCACGTGATFTGLCLGKNENQIIIGISVLKGQNRLPELVNTGLGRMKANPDLKISGNEELDKQTIQNSCILNPYAFSGYAKYNRELVRFKSEIEEAYGIPLDYIYTSKVFYALFDLLAKSKFKKGSKLLVLHSGGIQGNKAFEARYLQKLTR